MMRKRRRLWLGVAFLLLLAASFAPYLKDFAVRAGEKVEGLLMTNQRWRRVSAGWLSQILDRNRRTKVENDLATLRAQLMMYGAITGSYPRTEQGLDALVKRPKAPPVPIGWVQLSTELPMAPWGRPYQYEKKAGAIEL